MAVLETCVDTGAATKVTGLRTYPTDIIYSELLEPNGFAATAAGIIGNSATRFYQPKKLFVDSLTTPVADALSLLRQFHTSITEVGLFLGTRGNTEEENAAKQIFQAMKTCGSTVNLRTYNRSVTPVDRGDILSVRGIRGGPLEYGGGSMLQELLAATNHEGYIIFTSTAAEKANIDRVLAALSKSIPFSLVAQTSFAHSSSKDGVNDTEMWVVRNTAQVAAGHALDLQLPPDVYIPPLGASRRTIES